MSLFNVVPSHIHPSPYVLATHHVTSHNIAEDDYSAWSPGSVYNAGNRVLILSSSSVVTVTAGAVSKVNLTAHNLPDRSTVRFTSTGSLPSGISGSKVYYTKTIDANSFNLSEKPGGASVAILDTGSGTLTLHTTKHEVYEATQTTTAGEHPEIVTTKWVRVGATNAWRVFDTSTSAATTNLNSIDITMALGSRVDSVVILGALADTIQVIATDAIDGVVYDVTKRGLNTNGIVTESSWFFDPVDFSADLQFLDLPKTYSNLSIRVVLTNNGSVVKCANIVVGSKRTIGYTQKGYTISMRDFSSKNTDDFGNITVTERGFSREIDVQIFIDNNNLTRSESTLASLRATPSVYVGSTAFYGVIVFGYYEKFSIIAKYSNYSFVNIELRGLSTNG